MYHLLRPLLFHQQPEQAHDRVLQLLARASASPRSLQLLARRVSPPAASLQQQIWGLNFAGPVGLAAGFDKNGRAVPALAALGFNFVEVGTVTPRAQPGNPRPRMFRLAADEALINRLGFNNDGLAALVQQLTASRQRVTVPVGVNLGKNKDTPLEKAHADYSLGLQEAYPVADYFVVNVSSPNTPGLRQLQARKPLTELLTGLVREGKELAARHRRRRVPLLVKVAPDLEPGDLEDIVAAGEEAGIDGYVATNTTVTRPGLADVQADESGGLSGKPLAPLARRLLARLYLLTEGKKPLIGVGGIYDGAEAYRRIQAGASLVQVYTGLVFSGPEFPALLNTELAQALKRDGLPSLAAAVGVKAAEEARTL